MQLADLTLPFDKLPYRFDLHGLCDVQEGSRSTLIDLVDFWVDQMIAEAKHHDSGVVIPGDLEDEDRPSTRAIRRAAFAEREEVTQRDMENHVLWMEKHLIPRYVRLHKALKYGIVGVLAGHHWSQIAKDLNSVQWICQRVTKLANCGRPVPYWGEMSAMLTMRFRGEGGNRGKGLRKVGHIQHGEGGGQTKGATLTKLDRTSQGFLADFYIRAHDCQIVAAKDQQLYPKDSEGSKVLLCRQVAKLNLGSATRGYEVGTDGPSYVEAKMMRPTAMGWGTVKFIVRQARTWEDPSKNVTCDMKIEI